MRYFAAAVDAAGCEEEVLDAEQSDTLTTVGAVRAHLIARYGEPMARVLENGSSSMASCSGMTRRRSGRASTCCRPSRAAERDS